MIGMIAEPRADVRLRVDLRIDIPVVVSLRRRERLAISGFMNMDRMESRCQFTIRSAFKLQFDAYAAFVFFVEMRVSFDARPNNCRFRLQRTG